MRKLWFRRRAVSNMIGGIVVLALFLTALVAMVVLAQEYDAYQAAETRMEGKYVDRFTEKLVGTDPGLANTEPQPVGNVANQYSVLITNVAGIGSQIAAIYVNASSLVRANPCAPVPCILTPSTKPSAVVPNTFNVSQSYINPGEFSHRVQIWLPTTMVMLAGDPAGSYQFTIVTTRGGLFSFHYPFPPVGRGKGGGAGGTGIYIGPLVMYFEPNLISFTNSTITQPRLPIPGGWTFPVGSPLIIFIKIYNEGLNPVYITADSQFQAQEYGSPSAFVNFYLVAPMTPTLCTTLGGDSEPKNGQTLDCRSTYNPGNTYPGNSPLGSGKVYLYNFAKPYIIYPNSTNPGNCCGKPVYLLFAAGYSPSGVYSDTAQYFPSWYSGKAGPIATYLNLGFEYDDGTGQGQYIWGVNLPFISGCELACSP